MSITGDSDTGRRSHSKANRLQQILHIAHERGFAHVDDLASTLGVSRMTIHRDLDELHQRGLLRKVRGGASITPSMQFEADLDYRRHARLPEKRAIARAAIALVEVGDVVLIDDSTTALQLAPLFSRFEDLTVITNFQVMIDELRASQQVRLISLGGELNRRYASFVGVVCEESVARLAADVAFISTSSLYETTLYHQDQEQLTIKRAMLAASARRVLLVDHSKIGQRALYRLCDLAEFTHVVVDSGTSEESLRMLAEHGAELIVAETS